jgi:hypothetical protein
LAWRPALSQAVQRARLSARRLRLAQVITLHKADAIIAIRQGNTFQSIPAIAIEGKRSAKGTDPGEHDDAVIDADQMSNGAAQEKFRHRPSIRHSRAPARKAAPFRVV